MQAKNDGVLAWQAGTGCSLHDRIRIVLGLWQTWKDGTVYSGSWKYPNTLPAVTAPAQ
ncbi:MAG: hypothetical protein K9M19_00105 [Candidatus Marinimicrobia bacterium]|nr:hypothetical protein [Candidatus Neomarinimicrobiota bacterium]